LKAKSKSSFKNRQHQHITPTTHNNNTNSSNNKNNSNTTMSAYHNPTASSSTDSINVRVLEYDSERHGITLPWSRLGTWSYAQLVERTFVALMRNPRQFRMELWLGRGRGAAGEEHEELVEEARWEAGEYVRAAAEAGEETLVVWAKLVPRETVSSI